MGFSDFLPSFKSRTMDDLFGTHTSESEADKQIRLQKEADAARQADAYKGNYDESREMSNIYNSQQTQQAQQQNQDQQNLEILRGAQGGYESSQQPSVFSKMGDVFGKVLNSAATPGILGAGSQLLGYMQAGKQRDAADANMQKAQDLAAQMNYYKDPEVAKIQDNAAASAAQMKALQGLSDRASMGLTPEDQAALQEIRNQQNSAFQAQQAQIQDNAARKGTTNSGANLAQMMGASQQANQQANQNATNLASQNFQAKQNALSNLANTSANMLQNQFNRDTVRSTATDNFNNANTGLANARNSAMQNAATKMAGYQQDQATNKAKAIGNIGQGIGTAVGAYQQNQKKPGQA